MINKKPSYLEDDISQIPALQLLINLGYEYITPDEALQLRAGKRSKVILEEELKNFLRKAKFNYRNKEYPFSDKSIDEAVRKIRDIKNEGLVISNEKVYDLLTLGESYPEVVEGKSISPQMHYIDWDNIENNKFQVSEEFSVERIGSNETRRPDIIIFINGIPLVVIECKRPDLKKEDPIKQAINQHLRNQGLQGTDEIPHLFFYSQLLFALSTNDAQYGTTGTERKFWMKWKSEIDENKLQDLINKKLPDKLKAKLFNHSYRNGYKAHFKQELLKAMDEEMRLATTQDKTIFSMLNKKELLRYIFQSVLFDANVKKVARYNQDQLVKDLQERIHQRDTSGVRNGGVVWHTQGSGKSISMVLIAKAIALDTIRIPNPKIILVTDRTDLDKQLKDNFKNCGIDVSQAKDGKELAKFITSDKHSVITTIINKFQSALKSKKIKNDSTDVFILIDESHRTQHGTLHSSMKKIFPNACYIGFTGTPLTKKEKSTSNLFGGFIGKPYTIEMALRDGVICPLMYEGRNVELVVQENAIDTWFERITKDLNDKQKSDLKKKFSTADVLNKIDDRLHLIAHDIADHYKKHWQGTGLKGQLVTRSRACAIKYKQFFDEIGGINTEVVISHDNADGDPDGPEDKKIIGDFWKPRIKKYGKAKIYEEKIVQTFKEKTPKDQQPKIEIVIVATKLTTGFDCPMNTVLYLDRKFGEPHTLLQTMARVNRIYKGKDHGYILDYAGVLGKIKDAKQLYEELADKFDADDIESVILDIRKEVNRLPQLHSELLDVFKTLDTRDNEKYERFLRDEEIRVKFYEKLTAFSKVFKLALSSIFFEQEIDEKVVKTYKDDLKFFSNLKVSVQRRYAETINLDDYHPQIKKLLDTQVSALNVEEIVSATSIYDLNYEKDKEEFNSDRAKADYISSVTARTISEKIEEDPVFYKKLSEKLKEVIELMKQKRITEAEFLQLSLEIEKCTKDRSGDNLPDKLQKRADRVAKAFYGFIYAYLKEFEQDSFNSKEISADVAIVIDNIILANLKRDWIDDEDTTNKIRNDIDKYFYEFKSKYPIKLTFDDIDEITDECLKVAFKKRGDQWKK